MEEIQKFWDRNRPTETNQTDEISSDTAPRLKPGSGRIENACGGQAAAPQNLFRRSGKRRRGAKKRTETEVDHRKCLLLACLLVAFSPERAQEIREPSWGRLGAILGPSWAILGPSWGCLGALGPVLGPSWGRHGPSWGRLGAVLGLSGPSWGHLGAVLRHLGRSSAIFQA